MNHAQFHLIVVAHGVSKRCRDELGGTGSLMINTDLKGKLAHSFPFTVGDLNDQKTFVHILDDTTLKIVMETLDTVSDFTSYLGKKEALLRSGKVILAAGEEELLASYLSGMSPNKEHDFLFPDDVDFIGLDEGHWENFRKHPQRLAQIEANEISYAWDRLIEKFNTNALDGTLTHSSPQGLDTTERILHFMAREPRFRRRVLAKAIIEALETTPPNMRRIRVVPPAFRGDPYYLFLLLPSSRVAHTWRSLPCVRPCREPEGFPYCSGPHRRPSVLDRFGDETSPLQRVG